MNEKVTCIDKARRAKKKAIELYGDLKGVSGIGIARIDGGYAVRINLRSAPESLDSANIQSKIEGVPVVVKIVGKVDSLHEPTGNEET